MGNGASREEQLYQAVQNGNTHAVEVLRHEGASLEFVDNVGRTPLHIACTRGELFDTALTLLNLGANIKAYQPGTHGGTPLHLAAKLGLDRTVFLLLQRGADPLAVNDDVLTPLDLARTRGHISVVRMIEDRIATFTGMLREMAGPGFIEQFAPQWVTKKIWVVVIPTESDPRKPPKFEMVIYLSPKNALPRTLVPLSRAEVEEPKFSMPDPVLVLTDKSTKTKYKFLAEAPGDKAQIERLYKACKGFEQVQAPPGMPSQALLQGLSALIRPAAQQHQQPPPSATPSSFSDPPPGSLKQPESDVALQMAMEASLRTAAEEEKRLGGWGEGENESSSEFHGWDLSAGAGPSTSSAAYAPEPERVPIPAHSRPETHVDFPSASFPATPSASAPAPSAPPSAPPLPPVVLEQQSGPISYPAIDTSPVKFDYSAYTPPVEPSAPAPTVVEGGGGSQGGLCVVCWDAPAQAVCIPCGHLAGCMDCLSEIKEKGWGCPVCRATIQQVIKVYAV